MTLDAEVPRERGDPLVLGRTGLAQLGHDAEHGDAPARRQRRQRTQRRLRRRGVGVVGVVDHDRAAAMRAGSPCATARSTRSPVPPPPRRASHRRRARRPPRQRVAHLVEAGDRQRTGASPHGDAQLERRPQLVVDLDVGCRHVGAGRIDAERHDRAAVSRRHRQHERTVGVEHGDARRPAAPRRARPSRPRPPRASRTTPCAPARPRSRRRSSDGRCRTAARCARGLARPSRRRRPRCRRARWPA